MGYIPIVVEIKPDELLYSWISRLADANLLKLYVFGKAYVGQPGTYIGELDYDVKKDFATLADSLQKKPDLARMYEDHSTLRFDLMFETKKMGMKDINNVCLYQDALNVKRERSVTRIHICPECVEEDKRRFGFPYLHVSHHLKGVKACLFHQRMLMEYTGRKGHENEFDLSKYSIIQTPYPEKIDIDYAKFAYALFSSGIDAPVEALKEAFVIELHKRGYALHQEGFSRFNEDFLASEYTPLLEKDVQSCFELYLMKKKAFDPLDFIPLLMFLFRQPQKIIKAIQGSEPVLINAVCRACGKTYISYRDTRHTFNLCRDCYIQVPITDRFNNLVEIAGNGEYKALEGFAGNMGRLRFRHRCGKISSFIPNNFLYQHSRCECEIHTDEAWETGFECLMQYYEKHKTVTVPKRESFNGYKLGEWCQKVRKLHNEGKLSSEKKIALLEYGFDFSPFDNAWDRNLSAYSEYVEEQNKGHVERSISYKGIALGEWYARQMRKYSNGTLKPERLAQLRKIYPKFPEVPQRERKVIEYAFHQQPFEKTLDLLLEYEQEYGTLIVPKRFSYKGYNLGAWCQQMRSKRRLGILPEEQIRALDDIGFIWDALGHKWKEDMTRYRDYVAETGIYDVSRETIYRDFKLGYWYQNLKIARRKETFTDSQKADIIKIHPHFFS